MSSEPLETHITLCYVRVAIYFTYKD